MRYAIIQIGGKQYQVSQGETIQVEKMDQPEGAVVNFDQALLVADGEDIQVGTPSIAYAVSAKVIAHIKADKLRVATYKSKSRYRKVKGHRHQYTKLEILSLGTKAAPTKTAAKAASKTSVKPAAKKSAPKAKAKKPAAK